MGQLKHDGRATLEAITFPAGEIVFGDLYRVDGWTGFAMKNIAAADTDRDAALETAPDRVWYINAPAALNAQKGDYLYWTHDNISTFQRGDTHLVGSGDGSPCALVDEDQDANDVVAVRALNVGPSGSTT